jgi:NADPH:quinone reductase-like Zn-dependent oxidoreductase
MEAVVCHGFGESGVEEVPRPSPSASEVLVSVERVQLSVTECQLYRGQELSAHDAVRDRLAAGDG